MSVSRRTFTKTAALATAAALTPRLVRGQTATSPDPVRLGFIGVGNRGDQVLTSFLAHDDVRVTAIADLYQPYLDFAAKKVESKSGAAPAMLKDYRQLLDRKDVDAVVINTPDHWHALQMIHACQAGKDVYVEKPLSLTVAEGRAMVTAARKHNRVAQVGIQRRSSKVIQDMIAFLRAGGIGKITAARAFHIQNESPLGIGRPADAEPPKDLDWDAWLGPAPMRPYNPNRTLYRFRWFYDHSGGQLTNTGVHYMDMIQWALNEHAPRAVAVMGGKVADFDNREIPDTLEAMWTYPSGALVTFTQFNANSAPAAARPCEVEFRGTKGTLYFQANGYEVVPDTLPAREFPVLNPTDRAAARNWRNGKPAIEPQRVPAEKGDPTVAHARNFLDCVRSREKCACDIETGHRATTATLIGNIAHKTRALLEWDATAERFTNNDAANKMLHYEYRKPYDLPTTG